MTTNDKYAIVIEAAEMNQPEGDRRNSTTITIGQNYLDEEGSKQVDQRRSPKDTKPAEIVHKRDTESRRISWNIVQYTKYIHMKFEADTRTREYKKHFKSKQIQIFKLERAAQFACTLT